MSDQPQSSSPARERFPIALIVTAVFLVVFYADINQKIKIDGWAIILLIIAVLPWSFPALILGLRMLGSAFSDANIGSIEIGNMKIEMLEKKVSDQDLRIAEQRKILDDLALYSMAYYIYDKLKYLHLGTIDQYKSRFGEYRYRRDEPFDHDLRYLRDHGYVEMFQFPELTDGENLVGRLKVTNMGSRFVELKEGLFHASLTNAIVPQS